MTREEYAIKMKSLGKTDENIRNGLELADKTFPNDEKKIGELLDELYGAAEYFIYENIE